MGAKIMSNNGKRYDKEFKADIVRLVREEKFCKQYCDWFWNQPADRTEMDDSV